MDRLQVGTRTRCGIGGIGASVIIYEFYKDKKDKLESHNYGNPDIA